MAVLPAIPPRVVGLSGLDSPLIRSWFPLPGAAWREGDILSLTTATAGAQPSGGAGGLALATTAGPSPAGPFNITTNTFSVTSNNVTITASTSAGAPARSYYVVLTYTNTTSSQESLTGTEFIINCSAGLLPSVNVLAAGAPATAVTFAVYVSLYPGGEQLQQATKYTTALGTAFQIPNPLINQVGINRAASNVTTGNVGIALHDSSEFYVLGTGGSTLAGLPSQVLGTWNTPPPLGPFDPLQALTASLANAQPIEICLLQPWNQGLVGSAVGFTLDASGYFVASTAATAAGTIINKVFGSNADVGQVGDTYSRVQMIVTPTNAL